MKRIGFLGIFLLSLCLSVSAQRGHRGTRRGTMDRATMVERMTERQAKQLSLTEEQILKMKEINTEYLAQIMTGRPEMSKDSVNQHKEMTKEERRIQRNEREAKMRAAREAYENRVKEVLTPEQFEAFLKMEKEQQRPRRERRGGPRNRDAMNSFRNAFENSETDMDF